MGRKGCSVELNTSFPPPIKPTLPPGLSSGPQASSHAYSSLVQLLGLSMR